LDCNIEKTGKDFHTLEFLPVLFIYAVNCYSSPAI